MKSDYSVIISGGGPAGLYAAYMLASADISVLVLEKDREIGQPVLCAEGVSNRTLSLFFDNMPQDIVRNRFSRLILKYGGLHSLTDIPDMGLILYRDRFDRFVGQLAEKAGACIKTGEAVIDAYYEENRVCVRTKNRVYNADMIIAADGVESKTARYLGHSDIPSPGDIYSCYEIIAEHENIRPDDIIFDFSPELARNGYIWVFPRGGNEANIGMGIAKVSAGRVDMSIRDYMSKHYPDAHIIEQKAGAVPVNYMKQPYADRMLIIGDAGRFADPLTGGGIDNALRTAKWAALTAISAIRDNDLSSDNLSNYMSCLKTDNIYSLKLQMRMKALIEQMDNREHEKFFTSLLGMLDKKTIMSEHFYSAVEHIRNIPSRVLFAYSLLKGIVYKKTMIRILIKVLWK